MRDEVITNSQKENEDVDEFSLENVPVVDFLKLTSILERAINYVRGYFEHLKQVKGIFIIYDVEVGVAEIEESGHKIMCPEARIRIKGGYRFIPKYMHKLKKKLKTESVNQTAENVSRKVNNYSNTRNEENNESS